MTLREGQRRSRISRLRKSIAIIVKERSVNYFIIAFILFSTLFQVIAFVTSGWLVMDIKANNPLYAVSLDLELGLIYVQHCTDGVCKTEIVDKFKRDGLDLISDDKLLEYRIEASIGLLTTFVATILTCKLTCCGDRLKSKKIILFANFIISLISAAAVLTLVGRFGFNILDEHRDLGDNSPYKAPYSLIMGAVGGIFAALTAVTSGIEFCRTWFERGGTLEVANE